MGGDNLCPLFKRNLKRKKLNPSRTTKIRTLSLFGIVINIGIGVNVEGLTRVIPSSFSTEAGKKKNIYLMKVKPNYKLPSFRLGFMEVVTVAAYAVTASFLVKSIASTFKKISLLKAAFNSIAPGWTNTEKRSLNSASLQNSGIGRMIDEIVSVDKLPQFFLNTSVKTMTTLCAAGL